MADDKTDNVYCDRRPMTRKEIKFFGTAVSFDEEMASSMTARNIASPKFLRTQSFGMLSPKSGRMFFRNRDKNSNYDYNGCASGSVSVKSSTESLNRSRPARAASTLKLVHESSTEMDTCDIDDGEVVVRIEKRNRLIRMRMSRLRSRSCSTDSWDDTYDKR